MSAQRNRSRRQARPAGPETDQLAFDEALAQVEAIVERIESGQIGLEQSLDEYERGVALIRRCRALLASAEQRVEELTRRMLAEPEPPAGRDAPGQSSP